MKKMKTCLVFRTGWTQPRVGVRAFFKSQTGEVETVTTSVATQQLSKILANWAHKRESVVFPFTFSPSILLLFLRNGHDPWSSHTCTANLLHCSPGVKISPCQTPHTSSRILYMWWSYVNKTTTFWSMQAQFSNLRPMLLILRMLKFYFEPMDADPSNT